MSYTIDKRIEQVDILYNKIESLYHQIAIKQGLSDSAFMILRAVIILGEGITQTNIFQNICVNKQTINTAINNLCKNGIIYFENGKGREIKIYLTDKGKDIINKKIIPIDEMEKEILNDFTKEEYDMFIDISNRYINKLEEKVSLLDMDGDE